MRKNIYLLFFRIIKSTQTVWSHETKTDPEGSALVRTADCLENSLRGPAIHHKTPAQLMNLLHYLKHKYAHVIRININEWILCTHVLELFLYR